VHGNQATIVELTIWAREALPILIIREQWSGLTQTLWIEGRAVEFGGIPAGGIIIGGYGLYVSVGLEPQTNAGVISLVLLSEYRNAEAV
jgi:hypothetical protein